MSVLVYNILNKTIAISPELHACRGCLESEKQLFRMNEDVSRAFEECSSNHLSPQYPSPHLICAECLAFVRKFANFKSRCCRSMEMLQLLSVTNRLNNESLGTVDKSTLKYNILKTDIEVVYCPPVMADESQTDPGGNKDAPTNTERLLVENEIKTEKDIENVSFKKINQRLQFESHSYVDLHTNEIKTENDDGSPSEETVSKEMPSSNKNYIEIVEGPVIEETVSEEMPSSNNNDIKIEIVEESVIEETDFEKMPSSNQNDIKIEIVEESVIEETADEEIPDPIEIETENAGGTECEVISIEEQVDEVRINEEQSMGSEQNKNVDRQVNQVSVCKEKQDLLGKLVSQFIQPIPESTLPQNLPECSTMTVQNPDTTNSNSGNKKPRSRYYSSDSSDSDDLPDCLKGLISNIYQKDTKKSFPEPKSKKVQYVDEIVKCDAKKADYIISKCEKRIREDIKNKEESKKKQKDTQKEKKPKVTTVFKYVGEAEYNDWQKIFKLRRRKKELQGQLRSVNKKK